MAESASPNRKKKMQRSNKLVKKLTPLEDAPSVQLVGTMSSSWSITHKKDLMDALRKTNPAGVNTAPLIFWDVEGGLKTSVIDDSDVKQQMAIVESGVNYNIKRYNDLRVMNDRLVRELKSKLDELESQKKTFESLDAMKKAETEQGLRITALHDETNAVETEIAAKIHYSLKLEHMLQRLKDNQLKFDAHMTGMQETMRNIVKEGAEIHLMRKSLDAGLAKANLVLDETKTKLHDSRKDREVLLAQRKGEYKNAQVLNEWLKNREKMKIELGVELRGDLTIDEERFLKSQIDEKIEKRQSLQRAAEEGLKKLQSMEEAFAKLKQVTGVSDLGEMHEKFSNQKSNKLQLELEVKDAEHRLNAAKKANIKQEATFQELKSSGGGLAELNRENINRLKVAFNEARNDQKFIKADSERIATVLLGLHQGAQSLIQRVQPYLHLVDGGVFELTQLGEEMSPWTETVDSLTNAEHVLTKMMEAITGENASSNGGGDRGFEEEDDESVNSETRSVDTLEEAPNYTNNVRIKSKKYLKDFEAKIEELENQVGISSAMPTIDEEEGDNVVNNMTASIPVNSGVGVNGVNSSAVTGNVNGTAVGGLNSGIGIANTTAAQLTVASNEDPLVPSRLTVKKISIRKSQEAKRKQDLEVRQKRLIDRMENKNSTNAGADDVGIGITAKLKAQKATAERLSTFQTPPTLPEGVTLRDDAMAKTNAFLTQLPKLT